MNLMENTFIPTLEKIGRIYEVQLMMNPNKVGLNRGFAFVKFVTELMAQEAVNKVTFSNNYSEFLLQY